MSGSGDLLPSFLLAPPGGASGNVPVPPPRGELVCATITGNQTVTPADTSFHPIPGLQVTAEAQDRPVYLEGYISTTTDSTTDSGTTFVLYNETLGATCSPVGARDPSTSGALTPSIFLRFRIPPATQEFTYSVRVSTSGSGTVTVAGQSYLSAIEV